MFITPCPSPAKKAPVTVSHQLPPSKLPGVTPLKSLSGSAATSATCCAAMLLASACSFWTVAITSVWCASATVWSSVVAAPTSVFTSATASALSPWIAVALSSVELMRKQPHDVPLQNTSSTVAMSASTLPLSPSYAVQVTLRRSSEPGWIVSASRST